MIRLRTFGVLDLRTADGREIQSVLAQPKRLALLVYLAAADPGRFHRRDTLLALFWPELDDERARAALRKAVHLLRQSLGDELIVRRGDDELGVDPELVWCDAAAAAAALARGDDAAAAELYRGPFLDGFYVADSPEFERWAESARGHWQHTLARAACRVAEAREREGDPFGAAEWARRASAFLPQDETALRFLLGVLARVGDRAGAVAAYETFARQLAAEFDDEPSAETQDLIAAIRAAERAVEPSAPPTPAAPAAAAPPSVTATVLPDAIAARARVPRPRSHRAWVLAAAGIALFGFGGIAMSVRPAVRLVAPDRLQVADVLPMSALPDGYLDQRVRVGDVAFGEQFAGQTRTEVDGYDVLDAIAASPLQLWSGELGYSLYRGVHTQFGPNLSGIGPNGVRGGGSIAVAFSNDQAEIGLEFIRTDMGPVTLQFFRRDGAVIDQVVIRQVRSGEYGFRRRGGSRDIAGVTIQNRDPNDGLSIRRLRYRADADRLPPGDPSRLAVFPLAGSGAAGEVAARVTELLAARLDGIDNLHVIAADSLRTAPAGMRRTDAPAIARGLAAGWFLQGEAIVNAERVTVRAALYGPDDDAHPVAEAELDAPAASHEWLADALTRELLAQKYHAAGRFVAEEASRAAVSVRWLAAYLDAERDLERGSYQEAEQHFRAAVQRDPQSAAAAYRLSQAAYRSGRGNAALAAARLARQLRAAAAPADDRELLRMQAWLAFLEDRGADAERGFRALAATTTDADAWHGLAETVLRWGPAQGRPLAEVAGVLERALRLAPRNGALRWELARLAAAMGQYQRADFLARSAFLEAGSSLAPPPLAAEVAAFREAVGSAGLLHANEQLVLRNAGLASALASVGIFAGRADLALQLLEPLLHAAAPERRADALQWEALLLAAAGRPNAALQSLAQLESIAPDRARTIRELLLREPFLAAALGASPQFTPPRRPPTSPPDSARAYSERFAYALALAQQGRHREALRWLDTFYAPDLRAAPYGAPALYHRARIHEQLNEGDVAARYYRRFLRLWASPEPALLPLADSARQRIAAIETSGS